jgi:hypothetical protein
MGKQKSKQTQLQYKILKKLATYFLTRSKYFKIDNLHLKAISSCISYINYIKHDEWLYILYIFIY